MHMVVHLIVGFFWWYIIISDSIIREMVVLVVQFMLYEVLEEVALVFATIIDNV